MPWVAHEPTSLDAKVDLLRAFRGAFDRGDDFVYGIFDRGEAEVVGGSGLHTRIGPDGLEIGYWIRASRIGEGLATELAAALTRVAFEVCGVDRVEIRVDPVNDRSARIPRKLGYTEEATLRRRLPAYADREGLRDATVYTVFADEYRAPTDPLAAYDAAGRRIL